MKKLGRISAKSNSPSLRRDLVAYQPWILLAGIVLCVILLYFSRTTVQPPLLALGSLSKSTAVVSVPSIKPSDLNGLAIEEILAARQQLIQQQEILLNRTYEPTQPVFELLKSDGTWFSLTDNFFGKKNPAFRPTIRGPSADSRYLLNPFLLAAVDFRGTRPSTRSKLPWDYAKLKKMLLSDAEAVPTFCPASQIDWNPSNSELSIKYKVLEYLYSLNRFTLQPLGLESAVFSLILVNAKDFGFNFVSIDGSSSKGVSMPTATEAVLITDRFTSSQDNCPNDAFCNRSDHITKQVKNLALQKIPATLSLKLWYAPPETAEVMPDLRISLNFD